jgi:ESS family glutamate:Na+ symporter
MFLDFGIMAVLLVIAHILRSRLRLLQNLFVPTAIIAGFLGLAGGPQGLDALPWQRPRTRQRARTRQRPKRLPSQR